MSTEASAPRYTRDQQEFDRAVAFMDATFALALTLLVTTLEVGEDPSTWASLDSFGDALGTQFFSFAVSFVVISGYWLAHHRLVSGFAAIDMPMIVVNLALVAAIVVLPFSTSAVGDPGVEDLPLPTAVLAVNVGVASALFALVYVIAYKRDLLLERPSTSGYRRVALVGLVPGIIFLVSIPIAYLASPGIAQLTWLSVPFLRPWFRRRARAA